MAMCRCLLRYCTCYKNSVCACVCVCTGLRGTGGIGHLGDDGLVSFGIYG